MSSPIRNEENITDNEIQSVINSLKNSKAVMNDLAESSIAAVPVAEYLNSRIDSAVVLLESQLANKSATILAERFNQVICVLEETDLGWHFKNHKGISLLNPHPKDLEALASTACFVVRQIESKRKEAESIAKAFQQSRDVNAGWHVGVDPVGVGQCVIDMGKEFSKRIDRFGAAMILIGFDRAKETRDSLCEIFSELDKATKKHPSWPHDPIHAAAILVEEAGKLTQAATDFEYHDADISGIQNKAARVGAMALRVLLGLEQYRTSPTTNIAPEPHQE